MYKIDEIQRNLEKLMPYEPDRQEALLAAGIQFWLEGDIGVREIWFDVVAACRAAGDEDAAQDAQAVIEALFLHLPASALH